MTRFIHTITSIGLALGILTGCGPAAEETTGGRPPMRPTQVVAVTAKVEKVADTLSLIGTVAGEEMVELKSETAGIIEAIHFLEGQKVKKGTASHRTRSHQNKCSFGRNRGKPRAEQIQ